MRLVHPLGGAPLDAHVVGRRGARLGGLISLDLPVAPGFVVGTGAWHLARLYGEAWGLPDPLPHQIGAAVEALERRTGCRFDDPQDPLLLSVMPAPVASAGGGRILDVGLSAETIDALAQRTSPGFARQSYYALTDSLGMLPGGDARAQLDSVLVGVLDAAPAPAAIIVQTRRYGEGKATSGHGTAFTRDPVRGSVWPTGEFRTRSTVMDLEAFGRWMPPAGIELRRALARVESLHRSVCRVEFTLQEGELWLDDAAPAPHSAAAADRLAESGLVDPPGRSGDCRETSLDLQDQQRHLNGELRA